MRIEISVSDGMPIYRQISNQIKYLMASGQLLAGEELPAIRVLAEQLSVTPNTVVKAYGELENEGLLFKKRGAGTYVAESNSPLNRKEQRKIVSQRVDTLLADADRLGFELDEILVMVRARHATMIKGKNIRFLEGENHAG